MSTPILGSGHRLAGMTLALLIAALPGAITASAQQMQPLPPIQGAPQASQQAPKAPPPKQGGPAPAAKAAPKADGAQASSGGSGDGGLRQRVDQLEEQIVDMQVVIGTLESLAKSGGGGAASAAPAFRSAPQPSGGTYSSSDAARIDGLETQIRALTAQIEQLSEQMRAMGQRRTDAGSAPTVGFQNSQQPTSNRFGTTTVAPGGDQMAENAPLAPPRPGQPPAPAAPPSASDGGPGARQAYEAAYNQLLQQDYGAAEAGFDDFLKRYPNDALASNAQYWLGETYFVRGQFKPAADAFLKGYRSYSRSAKAPDSLLKLAMSLERLGQRDAACSSYSELASKYPNAPGHIRNRAQSERQRIGCA